MSASRVTSTPQPSPRRNAGADIVFGVLAQTGQRLIMAPTFLPVLLLAASGSELLVGIARAGQGVGAMITPAFAAAAVGHLRRVKRVAIASALCVRLPLALIAVGALLLEPVHTAWLCVAGLTLMGFANGFAHVALGQLRARTIPTRRQGSVLGMRNALAGLAAAGIAWWIGPTLFDASSLHGAARFVEGDGVPLAFAGVFGLAAVLGVMGVAALLCVRESASDDARPRRDARQTLQDARGLLHSDPVFARFFVAYCIANVARIGLPFYVLHAAAELDAGGGLSGTLLGACTVLWLLSGAFTRVVWGYLGDRSGHLRVLALGTLIWAAAQVLLLASTDPLALLAFFALAGLGTGGFQTGANAFVLAHGPANEAALRLAAVTTATQAIAAIAPLLGGVLGASLGFPLVFGVAVAAQCLALGLLVGDRHPLKQQTELST